MLEGVGARDPVNLENIRFSSQGSSVKATKISNVVALSLTNDKDLVKQARGLAQMGGDNVSLRRTHWEGDFCSVSQKGFLRNAENFDPSFVALMKDCMMKTTERLEQIEVMSDSGGQAAGLQSFGRDMEGRVTNLASSLKSGETKSFYMNGGNKTHAMLYKFEVSKDSTGAAVAKMVILNTGNRVSANHHTKGGLINPAYTIKNIPINSLKASFFEKMGALQVYPRGKIPQKQGLKGDVQEIYDIAKKLGDVETKPPDKSFLIPSQKSGMCSRYVLGAGARLYHMSKAKAKGVNLGKASRDFAILKAKTKLKVLRQVHKNKGLISTACKAERVKNGEPPPALPFEKMFMFSVAKLERDISSLPPEERRGFEEFIATVKETSDEKDYEEAYELSKTAPACPYDVGHGAPTIHSDIVGESSVSISIGNQTIVVPNSGFNSAFNLISQALKENPGRGEKVVEDFRGRLREKVQSIREERGGEREKNGDVVSLASGGKGKVDRKKKEGDRLARKLQEKNIQKIEEREKRIQEMRKPQNG